ncbi:MAG: N-acetylmuramic acid 6-phosphate etherase [Frankiales bacterium]|jgi:N-acetylmuramic acid 6-phosphate etherase|nr:N-acetylmuramic acid 6-phosphate etherase [Frankiales bacterium]MDX6208252.1 N-acetylmuramic acid 6-phosphate etherase [Frankiales bacterium]MDX6221652.1 N-acetylmuramic acid 6-phosphate etherase [Frankiales bacterium]
MSHPGIDETYGVVAMDDLSSLTTEAVRAQHSDLDSRGSLDLVLLMNDEDATVAGVVRRAAPQVAAAVDAISARLSAGGRMISVGAGTGGRLAVVDSVECEPTYGTEPGQVVAVIAGGREAMADTREGDEDDEQAGAADVDALRLNRSDAVIVVSASGRTPYALGAARAARWAGSLVVALANTRQSPLADLADVAIEVPTGPEIVAGSTRLKAGTAQKMVLNMLSTLVMVRQGHTFGNLMIDVRVDNDKLRQRAVRNVAQAAGIPYEQAELALAAADGQAKVAVVAARAGLPVDEARARLAAAGGNARQALAAHFDAR